MINKSLLIIAISARPYALAAKRSGFQVFVIDGFADADTVEVSEQVETCPFNEQGFSAAELILAVKKIAKQSMIGCIFGSGLEAQPALLEEINTFLPVIGNAPQTVTQVKNPQYFFSTLNVLGITSPAIFNAIPVDSASKPYLVKSYGGSGGQHIRLASEKCHLFNGDYVQEFLLGKSVSVLFLATKSNSNNKNKPLSSARIIGFNAQWVDATAAQPFRFGGVASGIFLSQKVKYKLFDDVKKITQAFGLVGLNSLDVIIQKENVYVLEVNPRLSASFDLYAKNWREDFSLDLIKLHIQASLGEAFHPETQKKLNEVHVKVMQAPANQSNAMAVIYAEDDLHIDEEFKWPDWTQDRPLISQLNAQKLVQNVEEKIFNNKFVVRVLKGHPVCSVVAQKSNLQLAIKELKRKVKYLTQHLNHWHD